MAKRRNRPQAFNGPPEGIGFVWMTQPMLESDAHRALGINARRILDFLMIEQMQHAGRENGNLKAPYAQLVKFGLAKSEIAAAIEELDRFGFVDVKRPPSRLAGRASPSLYRLTWLPTKDREPATNRWERVNVGDVADYRSECRRLKGAKAERKANGNRFDFPNR